MINRSTYRYNHAPVCVYNINLHIHIHTAIRGRGGEDVDSTCLNHSEGFCWGGYVIG